MLTKDDKKYISGTVSKAISGALVKNNKILIKEMGPEAVPLDDLTILPPGLSLLKENPVPPPLL